MLSAHTKTHRKVFGRQKQAKRFASDSRIWQT
jgi:hypothetical protein